MDTLKQKITISNQLNHICATIKQNVENNVAGVEYWLSYTPKTYKISKFTRVLYDSCVDVLEKNKSPLLRYLIIDKYGKETASSLDKYHFNELLEVMIFHLKDALKEQSYEDIKIKINTDDKLYSLRTLYDEKYPERINMQTITFRIPEEITSEIKALKIVNLGHTIEIATAYYVACLDKDITDIIYKSMEHYE